MKPSADAQGLHAEGHVRQGLAEQALLQVAGGDEAALLAGKGGIVGDEVHGHGGRIDRDERQGPGIVRVGEGDTHGDVLHAGHGHDFPGAGSLDRHFPVALKAEDLGDARRRQAAVAFRHRDALIQAHGAADHLADAEPAQIGRVIDGVDLQLEHALRVARRRRDMGDDLFKERHHGASPVRVDSGSSRAYPALAEAKTTGKSSSSSGASSFTNRSKTWSTAQWGRAAGLSILLITTSTGSGIAQGLFQHEIGLRHGPFLGIHQQQAAVRHAQHPLHLAAEIGVTRGVDDVDAVSAVAERAVLGRRW